MPIPLITNVKNWWQTTLEVGEMLPERHIWFLLPQPYRGTILNFHEWMDFQMDGEVSKREAEKEMVWGSLIICESVPNQWVLGVVLKACQSNCKIIKQRIFFGRAASLLKPALKGSRLRRANQAYIPRKEILNLKLNHCGFSLQIKTDEYPFSRKFWIQLELLEGSSWREIFEKLPYIWSSTSGSGVEWKTSSPPVGEAC